MKRHTNGFTIVEVVIVVIIVIAIGGLGWYVWQANNKKSTTTNTPSSSTTQSTSTGLTNNTKYLTIAEWNVRAPYSGNQEFNYTIQDYAESGDSVTFLNTKELQDAGCTSPGAGGRIYRYGADKEVARSDGSMTGKTGDEYFQNWANDSSAPVKKIGNYYYLFQNDFQQCSNDSAIALQTRVSEELKVLVRALVQYK